MITLIMVPERRREAFLGIQKVLLTGNIMSTSSGFPLWERIVKTSLHVAYKQPALRCMPHNLSATIVCTLTAPVVNSICYLCHVNSQFVACRISQLFLSVDLASRQPHSDAAY